jgi:ABC-2 type transport system permease protein
MDPTPEQSNPPPNVPHATRNTQHATRNTQETPSAEPNNRSPITHHASRITRYASIYSALWKNSVTRELIFKSNFLLWIIVELLWFGLQLSFIGVLYLHTDRIGSWTKWQVVMLIGASHFIQQLYQAFFLINCTNLSELVRTGKLDFLLLLPVNTRFVVSLRQVDLGAFVNATFALATVAYALHMAYTTHEIASLPTALQLFGFVVLCIVGIVIHYSLMFLLATISFWTVRAQGIVWGYYNLFNIARMPDEAFRGLFKAVFTFAIPMLLVSNVPARVLVKPATSLKWSLLLVAMSVLCFAISEWGWRASLRRYTSASS